MATEIPLHHQNIFLLEQLKKGNYTPIHRFEGERYVVEILTTPEKVISVLRLENGHLLITKLASRTGEDTDQIDVEEKDGRVLVQYDGSIGKFRLEASAEAVETLVLWRYRTSFVPNQPMYYVKDTAGVLLAKKGYTIGSPGNIYVEQLQARSGCCFLDFGASQSGCLLYFQNLSALHHYAEDSQISLMDSVKVEWPEICFRLPTSIGHHLQKGKSYILDDSYMAFDPVKPKRGHDISRTFLKLQHLVYSRLEKPDVQELVDYKDILGKCLTDLAHHKGCWQQVGS